MGDLVVLQLRGAEEALAALWLRTGKVALVVMALEMGAQVTLVREDTPADRTREAE